GRRHESPRLRAPILLGSAGHDGGRCDQRPLVEPRALPGLRGDRHRHVQRRATRVSPAPGADDQRVEPGPRPGTAVQAMTWRWWATLGVALAAFLPALLVFAQPFDRDVKTGAALYGRNCASCHGPTGEGDGPSAAGLATK